MTYAGWTYADSPDEAQLKSIGDEMRDQILPIHDSYYSSEKSIDLYPTTGTASDWYGLTRLIVNGTANHSMLVCKFLEILSLTTP